MKFILLLIVILPQKYEVFFLDLSKVFDKVWHDGLIYKLSGISGSLSGINSKLFR